MLCQEVMNGGELSVVWLLALVVDALPSQEDVVGYLVNFTKILFYGGANHEGKDDLVRLKEASADVDVKILSNVRDQFSIQLSNLLRV